MKHMSSLIRGSYDGGGRVSTLPSSPPALFSILVGAEVAVASVATSIRGGPA